MLIINSNLSLDKQPIILQVFFSKTGMAVQLFLRLIGLGKELEVQVRWLELPSSGDTFESLQEGLQ